VFANLHDDELRARFERGKTIAPVGLSPPPYRPRHRIARRLRHSGDRVIPVRPALPA